MSIALWKACVVAGWRSVSTIRNRARQCVSTINRDKTLPSASISDCGLSQTAVLVRIGLTHATPPLRRTAPLTTKHCKTLNLNYLAKIANNPMKITHSSRVSPCRLEIRFTPENTFRREEDSRTALRQDTLPFPCFCVGTKWVG